MSEFPPAGDSRMKVKLCAIARNEGAYIGDWVFHHLWFGFDAIEIWTNGRDDGSSEILDRISGVNPRVLGVDAEGLRSTCAAEGKYFQYEAYAQMADEAVKQGFTHAAFLDLDEYWVPRDFAARIHEFLPSQRRVNVVSFPWALDIARDDREPFDALFGNAVRVQLDPHVKSVVRLDGRVVQIRPHTARTRGGRRLLVRDPFAVEDRRGQQWGSFVDPETFVASWEDVPEAFVLHAVNRSQIEYVSSLDKAFERTPDEPPYRTNREGFGARARPILTVDFPQAAVAKYRSEAALFWSSIGAEEHLQRARRAVIQRSEDLLDAVCADPHLMERMKGALRGVVDPRLIRANDSWDARIEWKVESLTTAGDGLLCEGFAFSDVQGRAFKLGAQTSGMTEVVAASSVEWVSRPDVAQHLKGAPPHCGFRAWFPGFPGKPDDFTLVVRPDRAGVWLAEPSSALWPRPS